VQLLDGKMSLRRSILFFFITVGLALASSQADAATEEGERERSARQDDTRRPVALTINPLAFVIQRYGGNVEWSFARHHALVTSGYVQSVPVEMVRPFAGEFEIKDKNATPGFGGELGYRLYSGKRGADGLFIGGSFVAMPVAYPRLGGIDPAATTATVELARIYGVGGAIDVGAQTVTSWGLTIGGGLGASFLAYDYPNDPSRLPYSLPNVLPRLLLQTGYSF
jgi:hypothetical protein